MVIDSKGRPPRAVYSGPLSPRETPTQTVPASPSQQPVSIRRGGLTSLHSVTALTPNNHGFRIWTSSVVPTP